MTQLRISEAAAYLAISDDTLRRWIEAGRVPATSVASGRQVIEGAEVQRFYPEQDGRWTFKSELTHILAKVETHNHPTAISPFPGASTGAGGEIRDEGATGRGSKPKAGLAGF